MIQQNRRKGRMVVWAQVDESWLVDREGRGRLGGFKVRQAGGRRLGLGRGSESRKPNTQNSDRAPTPPALIRPGLPRAARLRVKARPGCDTRPVQTPNNTVRSVQSGGGKERGRQNSLTLSRLHRPRRQTRLLSSGGHARLSVRIAIVPNLCASFGEASSSSRPARRRLRRT